MNQLKVLHVTNHFYPCIGGIETMVEGLCKALQEQKVVSDVLCLNKCAKSSKVLPGKGVKSGISIYRIPFCDLNYYKIAPKVIGYLKDYDIIHVHGIGFLSDFLLFTKFLHKKPIIVTTHGGIFHTKSILPIKWIYFNTIQRQLLQNADKITGVSENDSVQFLKISQNVVTIENGIDLKKFRGQKKKLNSFLFVGRLSKNKRLDNLLRAFAGITNYIPDATLTIVGQDYDNILPELKKITSELNLGSKVKFTGMATTDQKLASHYSKSEFFVSASEYEGFGITAIEALASGCIAILNKTASFSKFFKAGFCYGIDFNSKDAAKLLLAIIPKARKSKSAKLRLAKRFLVKYSIDAMAHNYLKIYNGCLAK